MVSSPHCEDTAMVILATTQGDDMSLCWLIHFLIGWHAGDITELHLYILVCMVKEFRRK